MAVRANTEHRLALALTDPDAARDLIANMGGGGGGGTSVPSYSAQNKDTSSIPKGGACAVHSSGTGVVRAVGSATSTEAVGLAMAAFSPGFSESVQTGGLFELADWTPVTGTVSLAAKALYFLDPAVPSKLTNAVPTSAGSALQVVGVAVSSTTLDLLIEPSLFL